MKMERVALLSSLNTLKPALATKELIEELAFVWFDGNSAMAYNDAELGIQVKLKTEFTGGIRGALLLGLLQNSRAREISFEPDKDGTVLLKAARTRAQLALLGLERSVWKFPIPGKGTSFRLSTAFIEALKAVLIAVGKDTTHPETLGVTLYIDDSVTMFATDTNTIAVADLKEAPHDAKGKPIKSKHEHIILPTVFCEQLLRLEGKGVFMELMDDCALAGDGTGTLIYSRILAAAKPLDLWKMVEKFSKYPKAARFEIPDRLALALDRAGVLFEGLNGETIEVEIDEGHMYLHALVEGRGDLNDVCDVPADIPPVKFRTEPGLIKRALPLVTHMVCTEEAVRMSGPCGFVYLSSNSAV